MIHILNNNLEDVTTIKEFTGYKELIRINETGSSNFTTTEKIDMIEDGMFFFNTDDVVDNTVNAYKVEELTEKNGVLTVKGRGGLVLLEDRIIKGTIETNSSIGTIISKMIEDHVLVTGDRSLSNILSSSISSLGKTIDFQRSYKEILKEATELAEYGDLVLNCHLDLSSRKFMLSLKERVDKSTGQESLRPIVFTTSNNTISDCTHSFNSKEYRNVAIVAGEGEGSARTVVEVNDDNVTGTDRRELYVDAREIKSEGLTSSEYEAKLKAKGREKLAEKKKEDKFTGVVNTQGYSYKRDYNIGDIVTISNGRIVRNEVITSIEKDLYNVVVKVGVEKKNIIKSFRDQVREED